MTRASQLYLMPQHKDVLILASASIQGALHDCNGDNREVVDGFELSGNKAPRAKPYLLLYVHSTCETGIAKSCMYSLKSMLACPEYDWAKRDDRPGKYRPTTSESEIHGPVRPPRIWY